MRAAERKAPTADEAMARSFEAVMADYLDGASFASAVEKRVPGLDAMEARLAIECDPGMRDLFISVRVWRAEAFIEAAGDDAKRLAAMGHFGDAARARIRIAEATAPHLFGKAGWPGSG